MPRGRDIPVRAVLRRIVLMWAFRLKTSDPPYRSRRIARRRARAPASSRLWMEVAVLFSTPTAARTAARGAVRQDILTPVSFSWIARCSRRRIQISTLLASDSIMNPILLSYAATPAACRRTGPRRRWPVDNLYCNLYNPTPSTRDVSQPKLRTTPGPRTRPSRRRLRKPRAASRPAASSGEPTAPSFGAASNRKTSSRGAGRCSRLAHHEALV